MVGSSADIVVGEACSSSFNAFVAMPLFGSYLAAPRINGSF